jgi:hypothetical protein
MERLVSLKIDFFKLKNNTLNESFLSMFGETLKAILRRMFGRIPSTEELQHALAEADENMNTLPTEPVVPEDSALEDKEKFDLTVNGTDEEISAFLNALKAEYNYMDSYLKYGMEDEESREAKYDLNFAVEEFEKTTGILWPFV